MATDCQCETQWCRQHFSSNYQTIERVEHLHRQIESVQTKKTSLLHVTSVRPLQAPQTTLYCRQQNLLQKEVWKVAARTPKYESNLCTFSQARCFCSANFSRLWLPLGYVLLDMYDVKLVLTTHTSDLRHTHTTYDIDCALSTY